MPGLQWSASELKSLYQQIVEENKDGKQVVISGRSRAGITMKAIRQGLIKLNRLRRVWPRRQKKLLRQLKERGYTPRDIADSSLLGLPDRTLWAIRKMWGRQKLSDRRRSRLMTQKKVWQPNEKELFIKYLHENSSTKTPEEIGVHWNLARSTVASWQRKLNLKQPYQVILRMDYSRLKQKIFLARNSRRMFKYWRHWQSLHEEALLAAAADLREKTLNISERICLDCNKSWPLRAQFWHFSHKKTEFGTSRYFKHRCRLCENLRKRKKNRRTRQRSA